MTGLPWADSEGDEPGAWQGESDWRPELEDWPENLAGPEYWLYKKEQGDEDGPSGEKQ